MSEPGEFIDDLRLLEAPKPWGIPPWVAVAIVAGAALAFWLWRRWRWSKRQGVSSAHSERALVDALGELERLFGLVDREESRPYAMESSAIVRRFIEERFGVRAPSRSTEEFLVEAQHSPQLAAAAKTMLGEYLAVCDLLKFARTRANRDELLRLHEAAVKFVRVTDAAARGEVAA